MNTQRITYADLLGASKLWEYGYWGQHINIAVIDTGLTRFPSFEDNIIEELNFYDSGSVRAKNFWHGEYISNAILTIAPKANICMMRVGTKYGTPEKKAAEKAIQHCINNYPKYRIINISLSFDFINCPDQCNLCKLVDDAYKKGILVIVASGNRGLIDNKLTCPATAEWPLKVQAISTVQENEEFLKMSKIKKIIQSLTGKLSKTMGTSFSAGYATGGAALIMSAFPKITADDLRFVILDRSRYYFEKEGIQFPKIDKYYERLAELNKLQEYCILCKEGHNLYPFMLGF